LVRQRGFEPPHH